MDFEENKSGKDATLNARFCDEDNTSKDCHTDSISLTRNQGKLNCIDLFCGCGGLSKGFLDAGYNVLLGIDFDDAALETFQKNHGSAKALKLDLFNHENISVIKVIES